MPQLKNNRSGFTIIELLIAIAIIGIIATIAFFSWSFSTDRARVTSIEKNARTIKDYLDVVDAEDNKDGKITDLIRQINNADPNTEIKLGGGDVIVNSNYFPYANDRDILIVDCRHERCEIDGERYKLSLLFYAINNETKCNLDEALYASKTTIDFELFTSGGDDRNGYFTAGDYNFCVVPIKNENIFTSDQRRWN